MPPPDFLTNHLTYDTLYNAHHTQTHPSDGIAPHSPDIYSPRGFDTSTPPNSHSPVLGNVTSSDASRVLPFSPTASNAHPFSPLSATSTGGGGYDWLTLDFNPLLAAGGAGGVGGAGGHGGSGGGGNAVNAGAQGDSAANLWGGAFGPEISEGLEFVGTLGNWLPWGWEDGSSGNGGQGQGSGGGWL